MKRSASPEEAAAIAAAVERFVADHAAPQPPAEETAAAWTRAALLEGAKVTTQDPEGGKRWQL
jgi:hypothetical protein